MEKTRVPKGEKYWYIASDFFAGDFYIVYGIDFHEDIHDGRFALGNYFHTKEEAESMASKLRAVPNGADVIEMPSEEEVSKASDSYAHNKGIDDGETPNSGLYWLGWSDAIKWFKSKIVK